MPKFIKTADIDPKVIDIDSAEVNIISLLTPETRANLEKEYKSLNLSSDFIFCQVMRNPKICKMFLETLLDISIGKIVYTEEQKTIDNEFLDKGVRLDIYANDEKGTVYNIEMQAAETRDLPERSRYYQGNIDVNSLKKGGLYKDLTYSYVIFVCCFDPFGKGGLRHTFRNVCDEYPELCLKDKAVKIFLNTRGSSGKISKDLMEFLDYTENSTDDFAESAESELIKEIHGEITEIKENSRLGANYMTMIMKDRIARSEAESEGIAKGRAEGRADVALKMIKARASFEFISEMTGLSLDEINRLQESIAAS